MLWFDGVYPQYAFNVFKLTFAPQYQTPKISTLTHTCVCVSSAFSTETFELNGVHLCLVEIILRSTLEIGTTLDLMTYIFQSLRSCFLLNKRIYT